MATWSRGCCSYYFYSLYGLEVKQSNPSWQNSDQVIIRGRFLILSCNWQASRTEQIKKKCIFAIQIIFEEKTKHIIYGSRIKWNIRVVPLFGATSILRKTVTNQQHNSYFFSKLQKYEIFLGIQTLSLA